MLKYLFTVEYKDGTTYQQNAEDVSISDPKRSCFFDVKLEEVKRFLLVGDGHTFTVDLEDGHFEIDKVPFQLYDTETLTNFRLIFWREHTHTLNVQSGQQTHSVVYIIGWQANDTEGKNVQRVLRIT